MIRIIGQIVMWCIFSLVFSIWLLVSFLLEKLAATAWMNETLFRLIFGKISIFHSNSNGKPILLAYILIRLTFVAYINSLFIPIKRNGKKRLNVLFSTHTRSKSKYSKHIFNLFRLIFWFESSTKLRERLNMEYNKKMTQNCFFQVNCKQTHFITFHSDQLP